MHVLTRQPLLSLTALLFMGLTSCMSFEGRYLAKQEDGSQGRRVDVRIDGVSNMDPRALLGRIDKSMLAYSRKGLAADLEQARLDLVAHYRSFGYPDVEVLIQKKEKLSPSAERVVFKVKEGPLVTVEELIFEGNHSIPSAQLRKLWRTHMSGTLGFGKPLYDRAAILELGQRIGQRFAQDGYFNVRVQRPEIERLTERDAVRVTIRISEGPLFTVHKLHIAEPLLAALPGKPPTLTADRPFSGKEANLALTELARRLRHRGYPQPKLKSSARPAAKVEGKGPQVDVFFDGEPGPKCLVQEIEARGLEREPYRSFERRLRVERGRLFDGDRADATVRALYRSGLFERVTVAYEFLDKKEQSETQEPPAEPRKIRLVFLLKESEVPSPRFMLGYHSYEKARALLAHDEPELFGSELDLRLRGKISKTQRRASAELAWPELLGNGSELRVGGVLFREKHPAFVDRGAGIEAAARFTLYKDLSASLAWRQIAHRGSIIDIPEIASEARDYQSGTLRFELEHETLDNAIFPKEGQLLRLGYEVTRRDLGAEMDFARLHASGSFYLPFSKDLRLILSGDSGWLFPGEGSRRVPMQERFYQGGADSIRSFREARLGATSANRDPLGGEFENLFQAELQFRVGRQLDAAIFADAANLGRAIQDYGLDDMRYALGIGLRGELPIGPLRFDAAWNPDRRPGEEEWNLQLVLGTSF